jgi:hypothetical protein
MAAEDLRPISLQTISDAIRLLNESSRGTSIEYHLDFFSFLSLQGYWNFSNTYSLIRYIDGEAAAIILTCTDIDTREAYILYWGNAAKFRTLKIAQDLFTACCNRLFEDGFVTLYGVSVADRPVRRYRFIQALPRHLLFDMQADQLSLPDPDPSFLVQRMNVDALSQFAAPSDELFDWQQRLHFLRHAAPFLQFFGAFCGNSLKAYAVVLPGTSKPPVLQDLRSVEPRLTPGFELLRHIFLQTYLGPCSATSVFDQSYCHQLLTAAGLTVRRRFASLIRDLRTTCKRVDQTT